jgi:GT2 family glycosyltransferase
MPQNGGAPAAMNYGIQHAQHDWIVIADSDAEEPQDWLQNAVCVMKKYPQAEVFGGYTLYPTPVTGSSYLSKLYYYSEAMLYPAKDTVMDINSKGEPPIAGANLFFHKNVFERSGPFEESIRAGYDRLFIFKALESGFTVAYSKDLFIIHPLYDYESIGRFFARSITFARWRNVIFSLYKTKFETVFRTGAIATIVLAAGCLMATIFLPWRMISTATFFGIPCAYGMLVLRFARYMPLRFATGFPLLDIPKKLTTVFVYVFKLKPRGVHWKKR